MYDTVYVYKYYCYETYTLLLSDGNIVLPYDTFSKAHYDMLE